MSPEASILAQARSAANELARQGRRDAILWRDLVPIGGAAAWAAAIARSGLLGSAAGETGDDEDVRVGPRATKHTDCEDRVLRLMHATLAAFPSADVQFVFEGDPIDHVTLRVDGRRIETLPSRFTP